MLFQFFCSRPFNPKNQTGLKNVKLNNKISEPAQHDDKYQAYDRHGHPVRLFRNLRNLSHGSFGNLSNCLKFNFMHKDLNVF